jgi:hypothetical protein
LAEEKKPKEDASGKDPKDGGSGDAGFVQVPKEEFEGLKTKVGELGSFIDESKEFIQGSSVVITTLASDPELSKSFRAALAKQQGVVPEGQESSEQPGEGKKKEEPTGSEPDKTPIPDKRVDDVVAANRGRIISDFEKENGISEMKEEDRKQARQKVEGFLNEFGWSVQTAPLVNLKGSLDKAWLNVNASKLREEGKLEGFAQMRTNMDGAMPNISGGAPTPPSGEAGLTEGQKGWAKKLGVDEEKAKKTYLDRDNEDKRVPPAESKKE